MTTKIMDKKKLFQIQTVQSKLYNYKQTLETLLGSRKQLTEHKTVINPNYDKIDKLNNDKKDLENILKDLKKDISNSKDKISQLSYSLKELPSLRDIKHKNEEDILSQELERIILQKNEYIENNKISIENAHLDKFKLIDDINLIQNDILYQKNIISNIQLNSHSSRKDILSQLHQKTKNKEDINLQQNQINEHYEFINIQINELYKTINDLEIFKTMIVNEIYNNNNINNNINNETTIDNTEYTITDTNTNNKVNDDTLNNNYIEFKINKELSLNDKIDIINTQINTCNKRIDNFNLKLNKTKISNNARLVTIINNNNNNNRIKVLAYKDNFKIEKEKLKELQLNLDTLIYKYDSFKNNIINNIKLKLFNANNELNFDITRANERFVIMKYRNNLDFEMENNCITDNIYILNMKIEEMCKLFNITNEKLQNIKNNIENENKIGIDIAKLDEEITKYKAMISQNETNIILLSQ